MRRLPVARDSKASAHTDRSGLNLHNNGIKQFPVHNTTMDFVRFGVSEQHTYNRTQSVKNSTVFLSELFKRIVYYLGAE